MRGLRKCAANISDAQLKGFHRICARAHYVEARKAVERTAEDKERLRRALIAYGVPIPAKGGTLAEWAELLEGKVMRRE